MSGAGSRGETWRPCLIIPFLVSPGTVTWPDPSRDPWQCDPFATRGRQRAVQQCRGSLECPKAASGHRSFVDTGMCAGGASSSQRGDPPPGSHTARQMQAWCRPQWPARLLDCDSLEYLCGGCQRWMGFWGQEGREHCPVCPAAACVPGGHWLGTVAASETQPYVCSGAQAPSLPGRWSSLWARLLHCCPKDREGTGCGLRAQALIGSLMAARLADRAGWTWGTLGGWSLGDRWHWLYSALLGSQAALTPGDPDA